MMKPLILICALGLPRAECTIDTALNVVQGPDVGSVAHCGFVGQAYIADTALAGALDGEHYLKVVCTSGDRDRPEVDHAVRQSDDPSIGGAGTATDQELSVSAK